MIKNIYSNASILKWNKYLFQDKGLQCSLPSVVGTLLNTVEEDKEVMSGTHAGFKQKHHVGMMFIFTISLIKLQFLRQAFKLEPIIQSDKARKIKTNTAY